jgi:hypothetical protein
MIESKIRENSRLGQELAYLQKKQSLNMNLLYRATFAKEKLEEA